MRKKQLIAILLSGLMLSVTLTGCDDSANNHNGNNNGTHNGSHNAGENSTNGDTDDAGYYVVHANTGKDPNGEMITTKYKYKDNEFYQSLKNTYTSKDDAETLGLFEDYSTEVQMHRIDVIANNYVLEFPFAVSEILGDGFSNYIESNESYGPVAGYDSKNFSIVDVPGWFSAFGENIAAERYASVAIRGTNTSSENTKRWGDIICHTLIIYNDYSNIEENPCQTKKFNVAGITETSTYDDIVHMWDQPYEKDITHYNESFDYVWQYEAEDSVNRIFIMVDFNSAGEIIKIGLVDKHINKAFEMIGSNFSGQSKADMQIAGLHGNSEKAAQLAKDAPWLFTKEELYAINHPEFVTESATQDQN
jgi:hypothetical protein